MPKMFSSEDLEKLYFDYLTEQIKINRQRGNTTGTNVTRRVDTVGHPKLTTKT